MSEMALGSFSPYPLSGVGVFAAKTSFQERKRRKKATCRFSYPPSPGCYGLKGVRGATYEAFLSAVQTVIRELFQEHRYLLESKALDSGDRVLFHSLAAKGADEEEYRHALKTLTDILPRLKAKGSQSATASLPAQNTGASG